MLSNKPSAVSVSSAFAPSLAALIPLPVSDTVKIIGFCTVYPSGASSSFRRYVCPAISFPSITCVFPSQIQVSNASPASVYTPSKDPASYTASFAPDTKRPVSKSSLEILIFVVSFGTVRSYVSTSHSF